MVYGPNLTTDESKCRLREEFPYNQLLESLNIRDSYGVQIPSAYIDTSLQKLFDDKFCNLVSG
jgi:hypothetical protein